MISEARIYKSILLYQLTFRSLHKYSSNQLIQHETKQINSDRTISLLSGGISMAQKALNLEDIVAGNIIQTKGIGSMTWLKDGERYSRLENNKQTGGTDIVAYRAKDNSREVIIPSSLLTDKSTGRPIPVRSVSWSADNEKVLIYNNTRRVWRYDTRGDYWVLNLKDGALRQLGKGMPESSMMFAKFSPDGTRVAYVSNNNIYVEDIDSGKSRS